MKLKDLVKSVALAMCFAVVAAADSPEQVDGHFSSWEEVPGLVDSITGSSYENQLEKLHDLTRIKLGYRQICQCLNDAEHEQFMLRTKQRWQQWWKSTGEEISIEKQEHSEVDQAAFSMAWEFFGTKEEPPKKILPVWIPATWTLYVTFTNGDYLGREAEVWVIDRSDSKAKLTRLRGEYGQLGWSVTLKELSDFTPEKADQVLKALCYVHRYAPADNQNVPQDCLKGLYYPGSTLHLRDGSNGIVWNTEGYDFCKSRPQFGEGESGRTYYFLRSVFSDDGKWKVTSEPASEALAPYRRFLAFSKPYFAFNAADVIQLFGQQGGILEMEAMLQWADKQKAATNPQMDWETCSGDFGAASKVNVINSTRLAIQDTLKEINKVGRRLEEKQKSGQDAASDALVAYQLKQKELERYVTEMLALQKREEEEAILKYPQPLRDLIIADEHPDDPNLKHLAAAIQAIRNNPDPKLFAQLAQEMHEGTLKIPFLLEHILINENNLLDVKPWGAKEEAIAVGACIDALPLAKDSAKDDIIKILLRVCGGGSIEYETKSGGRSVDVRLTENGYSMALGGAIRPVSLANAQNKLRRLYKASREKQDAARTADKPRE